MNMAPLPPWSSGGVVVLFILWPMLSLAAYNSQGSPVVVLGMETPLVDHSVPEADFQTSQFHAPWEMDLDLILAKAM